MKRATKVLVLLLIAVFLLGVFSGCGLFGRNTDVEVDYVQIRKIDVADASAADKSQEQG